MHADLDSNGYSQPEEIKTCVLPGSSSRTPGGVYTSSIQHRLHTRADHEVCSCHYSSFSFILTQKAIKRKQELSSEPLNSPSGLPWALSLGHLLLLSSTPFNLPRAYQTSCDTESLWQVQGDQTGSGQLRQAGGSWSGWSAPDRAGTLGNLFKAGKEAGGIHVCRRSKQ